MVKVWYVLLKNEPCSSTTLFPEKCEDKRERSTWYEIQRNLIKVRPLFTFLMIFLLHMPQKTLIFILWKQMKHFYRQNILVNVKLIN